MTLTLALQRQMQANLSGLEARMIYTSTSRPARATQGDSVSKRKGKERKERKRNSSIQLGDCLLNPYLLLGLVTAQQRPRPALWLSLYLDTDGESKGQ